MEADLAQRGWVILPPEPATLAWAAAAGDLARAALDDPDLRARWLVCEGTWFVGVDALPTAPDGAAGGTPLAGRLAAALAPMPPLHPAQLSAVFPGYPRPRAGEGAAAFRYRRDRCAAHVDGILAEGPERRRHVREPHAWVLGIGLSDAAADAAPLTVWDGSHRVIGAALRARLHGHPAPEAVDVTDAYTAARRCAFQTCPRRALPLARGAAVLLHPHLLHGIAPWSAAPGPPRMTAYFRPAHPGGVAGWLRESPGLSAFTGQ